MASPNVLLRWLGRDFDERLEQLVAAVSRT